MPKTTANGTVDRLMHHAHVAATLAETGAGVKEIMYRLGPSSAQAALRYQHATQRRDRSIAEASKLIGACDA
jgi:integrase